MTLPSWIELPPGIKLAQFAEVHPDRLLFVRETPEATLLGLITNPQSEYSSTDNPNEVILCIPTGWLWHQCWRALRERAVPVERRDALLQAAQAVKDAERELAEARRGLPDDVVDALLRKERP